MITKDVDVVPQWLCVAVYAPPTRQLAGSANISMILMFHLSCPQACHSPVSQWKHVSGKTCQRRYTRRVLNVLIVELCVSHIRLIYSTQKLLDRQGLEDHIDRLGLSIIKVVKVVMSQVGSSRDNH